MLAGRGIPHLPTCPVVWMSATERFNVQPLSPASVALVGAADNEFHRTSTLHVPPLSAWPLAGSVRQLMDASHRSHSVPLPAPESRCRLSYGETNEQNR